MADSSQVRVHAHQSRGHTEHECAAMVGGEPAYEYWYKQRAYHGIRDQFQGQLVPLVVETGGRICRHQYADSPRDIVGGAVLRILRGTG